MKNPRKSRCCDDRILLIRGFEWVTEVDENNSGHVELSDLANIPANHMAFVAEGKTNKEIAEAMGLSDKTVKNYLSNIFEKLKIRRRSKAAVLYLGSRGLTRAI